MPWLDLLVCLLVALFGLIGYVKGFWRTFLSLFSSVVVIVLAILLAKPLANLMESWFGLTSAISNSIQGGIQSYLDSVDFSTGWIHTLLVTFLGDAYVDAGPAISELAANFSIKVAKLLMVVICAIVVFVLLKVVFWLILKFVKKLQFGRSHRPLDRIFGVVLGILKAMFYITTVSWIIFSLGGVITPIASWFDTTFSNNVVAKFFYDISISIMQNWIFPFIFH